MFDIIRSSLTKKNDGVVNFNIDLITTETTHAIYHELPVMVAKRLFEELYPELREKFLKDDKFMTEVLNEVRGEVVKKLIKE